MEEYIYKNIMSLATPIGSFVVCHGKEKVSFRKKASILEKK